MEFRLGAKENLPQINFLRRWRAAAPFTRPDLRNVHTHVHRLSIYAESAAAVCGCAAVTVHIHALYYIISRQNSRRCFTLVYGYIYIYTYSFAYIAVWGWEYIVRQIAKFQSGILYIPLREYTREYTYSAAAAALATYHK